MSVSSRKKLDEGPAVPDSTTKDRRPSGFSVGEDVYRQEGEQFYLGTIVKVDLETERYIVKFMDGTEKSSMLKDLHKFIESNSHCVICKKSKPSADNEVIECDKCGRGYHQLCHQPRAAKDPLGRWLCVRCCQQRGPNKANGKGAKKEPTRKLSRGSLDQRNKQHRNDSKHITSFRYKSKGQSCYCSRKPDRFMKMLQCQLCQVWFHEKCLDCLTHPLYSGDRFYVFVCKICNYGKEFVRRLELKWENIVHLAIFNLTLIHNKKYFDLETIIIPYINSNWNEFQLPLKILNCSYEERKVHIRSVLTKNLHQFKCGKEIKKRTTIWALREDMPPPTPPVEILLPKSGPISDALLKDSNKSLKFLPPTFTALATGKSYLINGKRDVTSPSLIHMMAMDNNGLSSSCSSDTDSKSHISKADEQSLRRDNLSIASSSFYSCGFVKKTTPFPSVDHRNLQQSALKRRWKVGNGPTKRRKLKQKGKKAVDKARKLVRNAIARPKKNSRGHEDQDLPPTPPSSSAPDTPQPSSSPAVSTPFGLGQPLATAGDTSGDENSSHGTLDSLIPLKDFKGENHPFHTLTELLSLPQISHHSSPITLPLPLTAVVQHPSPQRATKRQLCEKDIRIDRNGDVKRRRLRRTRSSSGLQPVTTASKTATIVPGRPGDKSSEAWGAASNATRSLRSSFNNTPSTSSSNGVDYMLNGRQVRASPRLSTDKKMISQPSSSKSTPVKQSPVTLSLKDLTSSVNMYFGAATRIASGEKYCIQAKRVLPSGKVQYLIEWEAPAT